MLIYEAANERFRFRHALAREAVYAELLPPERRALHAAIARALEAALPEPERGAADWAAPTRTPMSPNTAPAVAPITTVFNFPGSLLQPPS